VDESSSCAMDVLRSQRLSASDGTAARLDELQFDLGQGPCGDAMRSARPVLVADVQRGSVWPALDPEQTQHAGAMADVIGRKVLRRAIVTPDDARLVIQGRAFGADRPMRDVARDIVEGRLDFSRQPTGIEASE
jgi:hypothetical protein